MAIENAGDADDDGVVDISLPITPGSTSVHTFKARKLQNFNMEASVTNLNWLVKYVCSGEVSSDLHADSSPGDRPCKLNKDMLAWMCHYGKEFP